MSTDSADDTRRPHLGIRWTVGVTLIAVGVILALSITWWSDLVQDARSRIQQEGVTASATVIGAEKDGAPDGTVCVTYTVSAGRRVDECVVVGDAGALKRGQIVQVRYVPAQPTRVIVLGYPPNRLGPLLIGWLGGLALVAAGASLLALIRRETDGEPADNFLWLTPMMLGGFTTWAGFGRVASITRRRRRWCWAGLYFVGLIGAVGLRMISPLRPAIEASAFGLWALVWIGGLVHGLVILPAVCLAKRQATERKRPSGPLLPPGVPKGPYEGAVELALHLSGHDVATAGTGLSIVHAATKQGEVVCGTAHEPLLPTNERWPSLRGNPAIRCADCAALVGPRPVTATPGAGAATALRAPIDAIWVWRDRASFGGAVVAYLVWVAWAQVWLVGALYNPDVGGSVLRGTIGLVINLALVAWVFARVWRRRTELHPFGFRLVRTWSTVSVPWSEVGSFAGHSVFTGDGKKVPLPGIKPAAGETAARLNQLCGVISARIDDPRGLVEVPMPTSINPVGSSSGSGILHVADTDGEALCRFASGPCLPTFVPWRDQDLGCLELCDLCAGLEPPVRASRVPFVPFTRSAQPEPGHEWVRAATRSDSWGVFLGWVCCGGWILLVPGVWLLYRLLRLSTAIGAEGVVIRSFSRTRSLSWSEVRGFEVPSSGKNKNRLCAMTIRNEPIRLEAVKGSVTDRLRLVGTLNALVERVQNPVPV